MSDIFEYWSRYRAPNWYHRDDWPTLSRVSHHFNTHVLPVPFTGPLKSARVTLLYLAPGLSRSDFSRARSPKRWQRKLRRLRGFEPLSGPNEHKEGWDWWQSRTRRFGDWEKLRSKVAILEMCPYHSKSFHDWQLLAALPSCRVSIEWAQDVLFTEAETGDRVVICLRAPKYWGLKPGKQYGAGLFAPRTARSGHMMRTAMRRRITAAVQEMLGLERD